MNHEVLPAAIGRYCPLSVIGSGAMGIVYRAHDPLIDRAVAIKVVRTDSLDPATRAEYLERFRLEAQAAGRCSHPAIVAVHDFSSAADDPYIVMELVEGHSLQQVLRAPGGRSVPSVVAILVQVLDGLAYAHRLGVTHRDIKPANLVIAGSGQAKIADFGIARLNGASLTQVGDMLGTPSYMAPEQVAGGSIDHRADLFALGCILYEALTGRPPFQGRSTAETLQRLSGSQAASMVSVEAAGAGAFVPVLRRALAKSREQRFQSAEAFSASLQAASASPPPPAPLPPGSLPPGPSHDDAQATVRLRTQSTLRLEPATLQRVEKALAQYVGPMARMVVAQAADRAATAEEFYQALARSLQSAADRSAFLRSLGGSRIEPTLGSPDRPPSGATTGVVTGKLAARFSPEALAAAQAALAVVLGPMARVLVRQAAEQAISGADFLDRLCAHATRPDEAATLRRRLRADVEPRLLEPGGRNL